MSVVTYAELRHGVERCLPQDRALAKQALNRFVALVPVVALDQRAADSYGIIAAAIRHQRRDAFDSLIAAHAISIGVTLITNNEADFRDYPGLSFENRVDPLPRETPSPESTLREDRQPRRCAYKAPFCLH